MNPIELGKAIADVGVPVITAVMLILVVGLVWYLIRQQTKRETKQDIERTGREEKRDTEQKEERNYYRDLISGDLKKNADLNAKGVVLQKKMITDFKKHDGHSEKFSKKVVETLGLMCDKMNGGSKKIIKAKKTLSEDR